MDIVPDKKVKNLKNVFMNKKIITNEEKAMFRNAVKNLTSIKQDKYSTHLIEKSAIEINPETFNKIPFSKNIPQTSWISGEDQMHFVRDGINRKQLLKLKRGQISIEAYIDLHRMTITEALNRVAHFIFKSRLQKLRCIRIIHGKGRSSEQGKPILKNVLNQWLRQHPQVLAFHSAKPKDGGTGVLYVLLKLMD